MNSREKIIIIILIVILIVGIIAFIIFNTAKNNSTVINTESQLKENTNILNDFLFKLKQNNKYNNVYISHEKYIT